MKNVFKAISLCLLILFNCQANLEELNLEIDNFISEFAKISINSSEPELDNIIEQISQIEDELNATNSTQEIITIYIKLAPILHKFGLQYFEIISKEKRKVKQSLLDSLNKLKEEMTTLKNNFSYFGQACNLLNAAKKGVMNCATGIKSFVVTHPKSLSTAIAVAALISYAIANKKNQNTYSGSNCLSETFGSPVSRYSGRSAGGGYDSYGDNYGGDSSYDYTGYRASQLGRNIASYAAYGRR